ncbi:MAG: PAS domain-containing sensor histidine kinase [Rhodospirillaceae bacterium]|nr:MAG: PAS domain-containing sensor histidine kinase [Rhodospirillaceae bacterium]
MASPRDRVGNEGTVRFEALVTAAVDGIMVIDAGGAVQVYNPACERLFGYAADEVIGHNVKMLMPAPYQEEHDGYLAHYHSTREKKIIGIGREVLGRRKDGSTFPMYLSVGEGVLNGRSIFVGIIHDITTQQAAERRMRELQAELLHVSRLSAMGQMAAMLAHELNQPLTAIANYMSAGQKIIEKGYEAGKERLREALSRAGDQALRAGLIIQRMRGFVSRNESEKNAEDIKAILHESIALALPEARNIHVDVHFQKKLPAVLVDKIQIQQVLLNLLRNAAEAIEGQPRQALTIDTTTKANMVQISIADTGPGLAPEVLAQLFQPFVTTKRNGMGMGLSVCRQIIEAHGGQLWTEANPGGGAIFLFTVPQASVDEDAADV